MTLTKNEDKTGFKVKDMDQPIIVVKFKRSWNRPKKKARKIQG